MNPGRPRAIVVGGGPGGLTAAFALQRAGVEPLVVERADRDDERGSCFTLWPNALRALDTLGLGAAVRALGDPLEGIAMRTRSGAGIFQVDRATFVHRFGEGGVALRRRALVELLADRLGEERIRRRVRCTGFEQDGSGVTARFDDGSTGRASILIGADGVRSTIRTALFGPRPLRYCGSTVWRGIARFAPSRRYGITWLGCGAQFGMFPMAGERVYWFASVSAPEGQADRDAARAADLLARFAGWPEPVPSVIAATGELDIVSAGVYDMDPLARWSVERATLLGDAAHPSAPDLGQGACQAIEDGVVLGRCIARHGATPAALREYAGLRAGRTGRLTLGARRIARAGTWLNPFACWLRDRALALVPERARLRGLDALFAFEVPA